MNSAQNTLTPRTTDSPAAHAGGIPPEGSIARFIVDCAARARGEEPEPAQLPKVAEFDLSPVIAKLLAASEALAADPVERDRPRLACRALKVNPIATGTKKGENPERKRLT